MGKAAVIKMVTVSSALGAAALMAPAAQAQTQGSPWMDVSLTTAVHGQKVDIVYKEKGAQHLFADAGKTYASPGSAGYQISFGDGSEGTGANGAGGAECTTKGLAPFSGDSSALNLNHTYAKPGTYTITVEGYYCGDGSGQQSVKKTYQVVVGASGGSTTTPSSEAVHADAHIGYSVRGNTATIRPYLTGTQRQVTQLGKPADAESSAMPLNFSVTIPKNAKHVSGNIAGDGGISTCSTKGKVKLSSAILSGEPLVVTFPGPGTYPVTLSSAVCTDQGTVTKTVNVTIPAAGKGGTSGTGSTDTGSTGSHSTGAGNGSSTSGTSGSAATAPASAAASASSASASVGPNVNTDHDGGSNTTTWALAALAGAGALGGAGVVASRRRSQR